MDLRALEGRNIHSHYPVVEMWLDLEACADHGTDAFPHFTEALLDLLPSLASHWCSAGGPGGFLDRLREGTYLGHVVEHVALELQALAGLPVVHGKTRRGDRPGLYQVVYECQSAAAGLEAGRAAVAMVEAVLAGDTPDVPAEVARLRAVAEEAEPGPSTRAIIRAARRRGIPVRRVGPGSLLHLGYGSRQRRVCATLTDRTSCLAADLAGDKVLAKAVLARAGLPVPDGGVAETEADALAIAARLGGPVVVKPAEGNQGKGVALDLDTPAQVRAAFQLALAYGPRVIVERYVAGHHYRVLVVDGRVVACAERIPAHVVADGSHRVRDLIELYNADPRRGEGHGRPLTRIRVDPVVLMVLRKQNLGLDDVPPAGSRVWLRENANLSTGSTARDVTDLVHPTVAAAAVRAARAIGLDVAGVDLVCAGVGQPLDPGSAAIIEVNASPGLRMHEHPSAGRPRDCGGAIVDYLFPPGDDGRIPIVAVTGTNGKTTVSRLVAHLLQATGLRVGLAVTGGISIGGQPVKAGDTTGPWSARLVLDDPTVDAAVLETARGGIIRGGLAFDWCTVGVVTNLTADHLGQDGIETLEELADVKSLVVEAVRRDGWVVLNADDPRVLAMAERARAGVCLVSARDDQPALRRHLERGGRGVYVHRGVLMLAQGRQATRLVPARALPLAYGGRVRHQVENAVIAVAAAWGCGVAPDAIAAGLKTFGTSSEHNPGRWELHWLGPVRVILDYGHNPAAVAAAIAAARALAPRRLLGVVGAPGDRHDAMYHALGQVAAGFDRLWIKEDADRRGRRPGEVAGLIRRGALDAGLDPARLQVVLPELEAFHAALAAARPGDVVLVFYEQYRPLRAELGSRGRAAASRTGLAARLRAVSLPGRRHG